MASKLNNDDEGINDINITPFVDVVLVLLVIFMVTAPMMIKESLGIKLPKSESSDLREKIHTIGLAINRQGQTLLDGELIAIDSLKSEVSIILTQHEKVQALISADSEARHGEVIKLLDAIKQAGVEDFAFQIERVEKE